MYVETSAIVAILIEEPEGPALLARLERSTSPFTSVVTKVEAALALGKAMGDFARSAALVDAFLAKLNVRIEAVLPDHYPEIMQAAVRYGKGSGHPAKLNFGDCFSYASAKRRGGPLLYKGNDFAQTDLAG